MSERISTVPEKVVVHESANIGRAALSVVDRFFGRGYPHTLDSKLPYHNGYHSRNVGNASAKMSTRLGFSKGDVAVLQMAGFTHDIIQTRNRGHDERKSAEWLTTQMDRKDVFSEEYKQMARLAILGTEPIFSGDKLTGQKANRLDYPSKKIALGAKAVACADFSQLYGPAGPLDGHQLFREIHKVPLKAELPTDKLIKFQENQLTLLENYKFPLKEANGVLATHRGQVTKYAKQVLGQLEKGDISSWDQLLKQDVVFLRRHS